MKTEQQKHTPELLGIERTPLRNWIGPMRRNGDGKVDAVLFATDREGLKTEALERNDANAERIVTCWNACADIPNPTETIAKMVEALKRLTDVVQSRGDWDEGCFYLQKHSASEVGSALTLATEALAGVRK
jgi:hypothetical protein